MAAELKSRSEWEYDMSISSPPLRGQGLKRNELQEAKCVWYQKMTGVSWNGKDYQYRIAVAAWRAQFTPCDQWLARNELCAAFESESSTSGLMINVCCHCQAQLLNNETVICPKRDSQGNYIAHGKYCCGEGKIRLPHANTHNFDKLMTWWTSYGDDDNGVMGRTLRKYTRPLNNA